MQSDSAAHGTEVTSTTSATVPILSSTESIPYTANAEMQTIRHLSIYLEEISMKGPE